MIQKIRNIYGRLRYWKFIKELNKEGNPSDITIFGFYCDIDAGNKKHGRTQVCNFRKEAEEAAFLKSFEILEEQL